MSLSKEKIIEVALARFSRYGFNKTTMNEIAEDLKITKGNLYYYYADKVKLITDVFMHIAEEVMSGQKRIINSYDGDFMGTLFELLEDRTQIIKKYYILHLSENMEWIKGLDLDATIQSLREREVSQFKSFFELAQQRADVQFKKVDDAAFMYVELMKGIALSENISNIINCFPDSIKMDEILERQKLATQFIFENKIIHKSDH